MFIEINKTKDCNIKCLAGLESGTVIDIHINKIRIHKGAALERKRHLRAFLGSAEKILTNSDKTRIIR